MESKSFKDNPAFQFISQPEEQQENQQEPKHDNSTKPEPTIEEKFGLPDGYKIDPKYVETKSRRLQLVLQPSLYKRVKAAAKANNVSVNEFIHEILDQATRKEP